MSPIDFVSLAAERPELVPAWVHLAEWFQDHPEIEVLDPRQIAHGAAGVSPLFLAEALMVLADKGYLFQQFTVETPQHTLAAEYFSSPDEIPDLVHDALDRPFDAVNAPLVAVFRPVDSSNVEVH